MSVRQLLFILAFAPVVGSLASEPPLPRQRPLTDVSFEASAERLDRGRYLTEHLLQCFICHSERNWDEPGAPPVPGRKGAGVVLSERGERRIVAPNITPDVETGAGSWTDDMLARSIREGIGHDGRALFPGMWYRSFAILSDEDLASVVVYLRSIPPVRNVLPATRLLPDELVMIAAAPTPITAPVNGPPPGDRLARGKYLVGLADCVGCHTSWYSQRMPGLLAGGNLIERGSRSAFSSNITPHASGTGYPTDTFITVMRTGKGGSLSGIMPWIVFGGLTDDDLAAIHEFLGNVQPVAHYIGNAGAPRHCSVCGQDHPLGEFNHLETPPSVPLSHAMLERLAGRYRSDEMDVTLTIRRDGRRLFGRENEDPEIELFAQSEARFLAPGWLVPIEFVIGENGKVQRVYSMEFEPLAFDRIP
jgi:mono/diheme cytochrome c family protein